METSLYIFNDRLAAVTGRFDGKRLRIKGFAEATLAEGSVINGVVTDEAGFANGIAALKLQLGAGAFKRARICTGSSQVFFKRSVVPKQPKKKLMSWISNEFSDVETADDQLLFDMVPLENLGADKGEAALLCAAKRSLISSYEELMRSLGVKLTGVDSIHVSMLKLIRLLPETRDKTFILLAFDGNILDATLYVRGQYRFYNRTRLFAARGTAESFAEVERTISAILQFHSTERSGEAVSGLYYTGASDNEKGKFDTLGTAFNLPSAPLADTAGAIMSKRAGFDLPSYAAACGNLIGGEKGVNFITGVRELEKQERSPKKKLLFILPIALIALGLGIAAALLLIKNAERERELATLNERIAQLSPTYDEALALSERFNALNSEYANLYMGRIIFTVYPELDNALFNSINACTQGRFTIDTYTYDETERLLTLEAQVDFVNEVPGFAERLRDTELFELVSYTGYTSDDDGTYYCTVYCVLKLPEQAE